MDFFYPLQLLADGLVYGLFNLVPESRLGSSVNFFVYDSLKIFILLFVITFAMGAINVLFPIEKVKDYLSKNKLYGAEYLLAALFGTITPFCSCSSVPLFIGFVKGGIPLGVTLAFLISSPLVDSVVIAMLIGLFGMRVAIIYVVTGIVLSVVSGYVLGKMNLEKYLADWVVQMKDMQSASVSSGIEKKSFIGTVSKEAYDVMKTVLPYVLIGVAVGAFIHGYIPVSFFEKYIGSNSIWSVPIAVIVAVPLYANAAGVLPIAQVLVSKGILLGTVLAFMMGAVGLSVPSGLMLKKAMKWRLLVVFYGVVTIAIIFSGYFFNIVL